MSFEHPWSGLALLLFLPFLVWLRRKHPPLHPVGGLQPFRLLPTLGDGRRQRRPLSFWLFLTAYLCATMALTGPQGESLPSLLLEDRSRSMEDAVAEAPTGFDEVRILGGTDEVVTVVEILEALRQVHAGRPLTVWTDQPPPASLPRHITWLWDDTSRLDQVQGKILQALPVDAGLWRVHWALRPGQTAVLQVGDWSSVPLMQESGTTLVEVGASLSTLVLKDPLAGEGTKTILDSTILPRFAFLLSPDVQVAWEAALLAVWPTAELRRVSTVQGGGFAMVLREEQWVEAPSSWTGFPWEAVPNAQDIAALASSWRVWRRQHGDGPLDRREWLLPAARPAGDAGMLTYATALSPRRTPHWVWWLLLLGGLGAAGAWWTLPRAGQGSART